MPATSPSLTYTATVLGSIYASYAASGPALTINQNGTLTQYGAATFQDLANSAQALQVQNSLGNAPLTADTADMEIIVGGALSVSGNLTINGHVVTSGNTPTIAAGTALNSCGTGGNPAVIVTGDDTSGTITATTGSGGTCTAGDLADLTFSNAFGSTPHVTLSPGSLASLNLGAYYSGTTTSGVTISIGNAPANSVTYSWSYWIAQ
jgi:hypothetical protein